MAGDLRAGSGPLPSREKLARMARALLVTTLVPLLGIAVLGIGLGYRTPSTLGVFVLAWAVVLVPFVVVVAIGSSLAAARLGCTARWHFALGGFLIASLLAVGWLGPLDQIDRGSPTLLTLWLAVLSGVVGSATAVVFWRLAIR